MMAGQETQTEPHTQTAVVAVGLLLLVARLLAAMAVTAVTEPRLAFLDRPRLMPEAAVAALIAEPKQKALAVLAAAVKALNQQRRLLLERLTPEVVGAAMEAIALRLLARAAPASSSSSTTSALPQSSPSSHRKSGLHQRVR
jgi:hypothetical protein